MNKFDFPHGTLVRRFLSVLCMVPLMFSAIHASAEEMPDDLLGRLTDELIAVARPEPGVGEAAQEAAERLEELDHPKVVEAMLPLLKHEKKGVPYLASYVIADCRDGLRPEHFSQLKEGYRNGGGWLPVAIASLGTDEAASFLTEEFRGNPRKYGQVDWALISMGERVVPFLLKAFDDSDPEREQPFFEGLRHLFKGDFIYAGLKEKAGIAIPHLIKTAESKDADLRRRQEAIILIGCVGKAATPFFPRLRALAREEPDKFDEAVRMAFFSSETSATAELLADLVDAGADHLTVREIALLGTEAMDVGPRALRWLNNPDWEIRVMAARTLGAIGYKDADKPLQELLSSKADWRLAYVAAKSLADLGAAEAIPALEEASRVHWFPIVRDAAKGALRSLEHGDNPKDPGSIPARDLVDYGSIARGELSIKEEDLVGLAPRRSSAGRRTSFKAFQQSQPVLAAKFVEVRNMTGKEILEGRGSIIQFPVDKGLLLGAAAGEWVGGLHYAPKEGEHQRLLQENITGIEKWKGRVFVASGTSHMGSNKGFVHEVSLEEGKATLTPWFVLPGLPTSMWVTEDEKLILVCIGGTLAFSDEGEFRYYGSEPPEQNNTEQDGAPQPPPNPTDDR